MKNFVDRGNAETLELRHVESLRSRGKLSLRNRQRVAFSTTLGNNGDFLKRGGRLHRDFVGSLVDGERDGLHANVAEPNLVFLVLNLHGEVAIEVGDSTLYDTSVGINLADGGTDQGFQVVAHSTVHRRDGLGVKVNGHGQRQ